MNLRAVFRTYRKGIILSFLFVMIEKIAWIIEPTVFGDVIDAMINRLSIPPEGTLAGPLLLWIAIFGINSGVGTYRRHRDEKTFLAIYNDLVAGIARKVQKGSLDPSRAAARAELSHEVVAFFHYRIPELLEQNVDIIGAIIALSLFDWRLGATCGTILVPTFFMSRMYNKKVSFYQKQIHDQQEDVYGVFSTNDPRQVHSYYTGIAKWKQKLADLGALNFGILRLFLLGIFLVILFVAIDLDDFSTGNIYSIVAYIWTFVTSSEYLPEQLESLTSVKDISERLREEEEPANQAEEASNLPV